VSDPLIIGMEEVQRLVRAGDPRGFDLVRQINTQLRRREFIREMFQRAPVETQEERNG
jgi:hypothetical protein